MDKKRIEDIFFSFLRVEIENEQLKSEDIVFLQDESAVKALYRLSKKHELAHLIGSVIEKCEVFIENKTVKTFINERNMAVFQYEQRQYEIGKIFSCFEEFEIPYIPLKGAKICKYYPQEWYRSCCDIDILIPEELLLKATDLLINKLDYSLICEGSHDVSFATTSGIILELHFKLMEDVEEYVGIFDTVWDRAERVTKFEYKMVPEMLYFYHMAHLAKHFKAGGGGVRSVLDVWILNKSSEFEISKMKPLLQQGCLLKFAEAILLVANSWFKNKKVNKLVEQVKEYILYSGIYGNVDNRAAVNQVKNGGKIKYLLSRIFVSYDSLLFHFPILKKHKWLFPFCQVARWFKLLFGNKSSTTKKELQANARVSKRDREKIKSILKGLGL